MTATGGEHWETISAAGVFALACAIALALLFVLSPGAGGWHLLQTGSEQRAQDSSVPTKEEIMASLTAPADAPPDSMSDADRQALVRSLSAPSSLRVQMSAQEKQRVMESLSVPPSAHQ
jgi:hypothetical protein